MVGRRVLVSVISAVEFLYFRRAPFRIPPYFGEELNSDPRVNTMLRKAFTVEEANSLIPVLEQVFRSIETHKGKIRSHGEKLEVLNLLWSGKIDDRSNPDFDSYQVHKRAIENDISEIERIIQDEIIGRGIRFPAGGIEEGLVDFPTTYEGRWVYLCWKNGEPELLFWHETDTGFPGRQKITDYHKKVMGTEDYPGSVDDSALDF